MKDSKSTTIDFDSVSKFYARYSELIVSVCRFLPASPVSLGQTGGEVDSDEFDGPGYFVPVAAVSKFLVFRPISRATVSQLGYCTQFDSFPRGLTGKEFISRFCSYMGSIERRLKSSPSPHSNGSVCSMLLTARLRLTAKACASGFDWHRPSRISRPF